MTDTILVTGATGNVGSGLVSSLIAKGASVRALVREPSRAPGLTDAGVEVVIGDLDRPETPDAAFGGVGTVFLVTPGNPNQVTQAHNGIAATKRAGVPHLVRLSAESVRVAADTPARIPRQHAAIDPELVASGLAYTILRPHFFMQNLLMAAESVASDGALYMPVKDGRVGMIDVRDVVEVATKVLTEDGHEGHTYGLTGPALDLLPRCRRRALEGAEQGGPVRRRAARGRPGGDGRHGDLGVARRRPQRVFPGLQRGSGRLHDARRGGTHGSRSSLDRGVRA